MGEQIEVVYGLVSNTGDGNEHLWHLGVFLTEEKAYEEWKNMLNNYTWIEEIKVNKGKDD